MTVEANQVWQDIPAAQRPIRFRFADHGLGDVVHCCHVLKLYQQDGYPVEIQAEANKRWVWEAAGIPIHEGHDLPTHPYHYPTDFFDLEKPDHTHSKIAHLTEIDPRVLPRLGDKATVWDRICNTTIDASGHISEHARQAASKFVEGLPEPIILLHSKGTNWQSEKSIPDAVAFQLLLDLLDVTAGSLITVDWDGRAPTVGHRNVRPIKPNWGHISLEEFGALCLLADLMIGIDSGPFHLAGWFPVPTLFVGRQIPAVRCCIPSPRATYLVPAKQHDHWASRDDRWHFVEYPGEEPTSRDIAQAAASILRSTAGPRIMPISQQLIPGEYLYRRVGHDERMIELLPSGLIGQGAAGRERSWRLVPTPAGQSLVIYGDNGGDTCHLQPEHDQTWRGRWLEFERMPIELVPVRKPEPVFVTKEDLEPVPHLVDEPRDELPSPGIGHPSDELPDAPVAFYVGIPTYCCFDLLEKCIEAVLASDWLPQRIFVIDNSQGACPRHPSRRVQVFSPPRNLGAGGAWNFLLPATQPYPCIMLNDDIEVAPDLLRSMLQAEGQIIVGDGRLAFTACLIRDEAWKKVGPLDPQFWPAYYEDCDWCYRATLQGYSLVCPLSGGFRNNGPSATKARMNDSDRRLLDRHYDLNTDYYRRKWGGPPHSEVYTTPFNGASPA